MLEIQAEQDHLVDYRETQALNASNVKVDWMTSRPFEVVWAEVMRDPAVNAVISSRWRTSVRRYGLLQGLLRDARQVRAMLALETGEAPPVGTCSQQNYRTATPISDYAGIYQSRLGPIEVFAEGSSIRIQMVSLSDTLISTAQDSFCAPNGEAEIRFDREEDGRITGLRLQQYGREASGRTMSTP
jgi:hypothetical protein